MEIFRYIMAHDYGLAPNPFGKFCTLAVCKSVIRKNKNLKEGDWVLGFGGKGMKMSGRLIHAMKIDEVISLQDYWHDARFQYKKPVHNGSLIQLYGDNFYHHEVGIKNPELEDWIQEHSAHSLNEKEMNMEHLERDVRGENVLVAKQGEYYYWGKEAIILPKNMQHVCSKVRDVIYKDLSAEQKDNFVNWLTSNYEPGIMGSPSNWSIAHGVEETFLTFEEEE